MTLTAKQLSLLATRDNLRHLEERMTEKTASKQDMDKILTAVDGLAKKMDNFSAKMAASRGAIDRHDEAIADLKTRVRVLERKITRK